MKLFKKVKLSSKFGAHLKSFKLCMSALSQCQRNDQRQEWIRTLQKLIQVQYFYEG